ncbi:MAG: phasin family protein, partial [Alphaproteobacteria bacterium]|nr:phasin family protein [Alphaproteobacteria bacterium]
MAANGKTNGTMFPEWDFSKVWADMKMPEFDVDALIAVQQKNIEAMNMANKAAVDGWQAFAKKQAELWQAAVEDTGALAQDVAAAKEPADKIAKQAAFAKSSIEAGISNAREAQELAAKATNKTVDIVSKRWVESVEEAVAM